MDPDVPLGLELVGPPPAALLSGHALELRLQLRNLTTERLALTLPPVLVGEFIERASGRVLGRGWQTTAGRRLLLEPLSVADVPGYVEARSSSPPSGPALAPAGSYDLVFRARVRISAATPPTDAPPAPRTVELETPAATMQIIARRPT